MNGSVALGTMQGKRRVAELHMTMHEACACLSPKAGKEAAGTISESSQAATAKQAVHSFATHQQSFSLHSQPTAYQTQHGRTL
jgi:hypothetical protein